MGPKISDHFSVDPPGLMYICTRFDKNTIINEGDAILVISKVVTLISILYAGPNILDHFSVGPGPMYMCTKFWENLFINKGRDVILVIFKIMP